MQNLPNKRLVVVVDAILPKRSSQHARAIRRGEGAPEYSCCCSCKFVSAIYAIYAIAEAVRSDGYRPAESHFDPRFPGTPSHAARPPYLPERACFATSWHVPLGSSSLRGERLRARVMSGQSSPRSTWPPPDDRSTDCFYQGRSKVRSMI